MYYWILSNNTTGQIGIGSGTHAPDNTIAPTGFSLIGPYDDTDNPMPSDFQAAYNNPSQYLYENGKFVHQPYFTLANSNSTITATLNNPPATPPTSATFIVCGQTFTEALTNGQATLTLAIHPSVVTQAINVSVSATGCVGSSINIGGTASQVELQVYTPTGGIPTVAPTGAGSKAYLSAYYALSPASLQSLLADIGTAVSLLTDVVFSVLVPFAQQSTYAPLSLSANQSNALADIKANVLPNLFTTLSNAYPSGGVKQLQYADYTKDLAGSYKAYESYMSDLQNIPNLA